MGLRPGEVFINGKDPETARALIAASNDVGLDPALSVRTAAHGFIVPDAVADALTLTDPDTEF